MRPDTSEFKLGYEEHIDADKHLHIQDNTAIIAYLVWDKDPWSADPRDCDNVGRMEFFGSVGREYDIGDKTTRNDHDEHLRNIAEEICPALAENVNYWHPDYHDDNPFLSLVAAQQGYDAAEKIGMSIVEKIIAEALQGAVFFPLHIRNYSSAAPLHLHSGNENEIDPDADGYIYASPEKIKEEYGDGPEARAKAARYLQGEIEEYKQYLAGEVYGCVIQTFVRNTVDEPWRTDDSDEVWSIIGEKYAEEELKCMFHHAVQQLQAQASEADPQPHALAA